MTDKYFLYYLGKCFIGAIICFALHLKFPGHQFIWSLVSVLLVIASEDRDSIDHSLSRIEANIIGASIGMFNCTVAVMEREKHNWHIALDRMFSVFVGCILVVLLTLITYTINSSGKKTNLGDGAE